MPHPPEHKLRWYQYKLSSLFILMTLVAMVCAWYVVPMQKAAKRRAAIAAIRGLGGRVKYYDATNLYTRGQPPSWYSWLRRLHGDEHLGNAVGVSLRYANISDAGLVHLKGLTKLRMLDVGGKQITDAELVNLKGLTKLEWLYLGSTQITDAGLEHLKGLTKLEQLWLYNTQITDAGLIHLEGLTNLKELNFRNTQITDAGLVHLEGLTKLETLDLSATQITDAGLVNLNGLTNLEKLWLWRPQAWGPQVTDEGVKKLQEALPNCGIFH